MSASSGKGSRQRPLSVPRAEYDRRWQDTFAPEARDTSTEIAGDGAPSGAPLWPTIYEQTRIGNMTLTHHPLRDCAGHHCCIHNPSVHAMNDFPLHWRGDRGMMERTCPHGVGHPDPDHITYVRRTRGDDAAWTESIHGCDGCCDRAGRPA